MDHAISQWIPALLGSAAFMRLRNPLLRVAEPAAICKPLFEPIDPARLAAAGGGSG